jgi:hypothetical protein
MAYQQFVANRGDVDNQAPAIYTGKLEDLMGCLRLIQADIVELYSVIANNGVVIGGTSLVTDTSPGVGPVTGYAPSGFGTTSTRLDIQANASNTTINDLPIGADNQNVRIRNTGSAGILILISENAGSTAAKRFLGKSDMGLAPNETIDLVYYAGSVNRWTM